MIPAIRSRSVLCSLCTTETFSILTDCRLFINKLAEYDKILLLQLKKIPFSREYAEGYDKTSCQYVVYAFSEIDAIV